MFEIDPAILKTMGVCWVLSAVVHSLPPIKEDSPALYKFVYTFVHTLFANVGMLTRKPIPQIIIDPSKDTQKN